jgi:hypothetical protein
MTPRPYPGIGKPGFEWDSHAAWEDLELSLPTIAKSTDTAMFLEATAKTKIGSQ